MQTGKVNLNTYILSLVTCLCSAVLAVAGFVAHRTIGTSDKVSVLAATMDGFMSMRAMEQQQIVEIKDSLKTLNMKISDTVTRVEMKERLDNYERRIRDLENKFKQTTVPAK